MSEAAIGKKIETQVQFWSLLGPFLLLLSITVLLFKVSAHWYFPVSALIGIPLCLKWKMKGMAVALCTLLLFSGIGYQNLELDDRYWHVGLSIAMAFSFIVMTLSLEEVQGLVAKLARESQSRLDNFVLLEDKLQVAEQEWAAAREKLKNEHGVLSLEATKAQEEKQVFHKLAQLAKEELLLVRGQHEQLLQNLHYKKQQIAQLYERLEETELSLQDFVTTNGEKQLGMLKGQIASLERDKEVLQGKIGSLQNDAQVVLNKMTFFEEERQTLLQAKASLQQQCEQMRQTEPQQRLQLQQTQQKMHELKIKLFEEEQQREAILFKRKELQEQAGEKERIAKLKEEQCKGAIQEASKQLFEQKAKFEAQLAEHKQHAHQLGSLLQKTVQEGKICREKCQKMDEELATARQVMDERSRELDQCKYRVAQDKEQILQLHAETLKKQQETFETQLQALQDQAKQQRDQQQVAVSEALSSAEQELEGLRTRLKTKEHEATQLQTQLQETIDQSKGENHGLAQKKERLKNEVSKLPFSPSNSRQIEGMYLQLKSQFEEKCEVLNATRRDLFKANEEILSLLKLHEEEKVYGLSSNEKSLQRDLLRLSHQFDHMQQRYEQENQELVVLVDHLLRELTCYETASS